MAPTPIRTGPAARQRRPRIWLTRTLIVGIVLAALNLRPAITSLGALLEEVRDGLGMSGSIAGLLTSVPPLCFAVFGVSAPRLARRFGPGAVVCAGMVAITLGLALRPFAGSTPVFLAASALALMGIAVGNILMPVIVKRWFPQQVGTMTGLYSMGLAAGTAAAAAVAVPVTDALGGSWRLGLGVWALLAALAVIPWALLARHRDEGAVTVAAGPEQTEQTEQTEETEGSPVAVGAGERDVTDGSVREGSGPETPDHSDHLNHCDHPDPEGSASEGRGAEGPAPDGLGAAHPGRLRITHSPTAWALAVFFGLQASGAYITMGWMPQVFRDAGVSADTAGLLLAVIMVMGVPLAFVIPRVAVRLTHQGPIVVVLGVCGLVGYAGLYLAPAGGAFAWALLLGVSNCAFPLALTMVGMRARTGAGVAQLSGFAQSCGYLISIPGPLLVGVLYQSSGGWSLPIALMAGLMVPQILVGLLAGRNRTIESECALPATTKGA